MLKNAVSAQSANQANSTFNKINDISGNQCPRLAASGIILATTFSEHFCAVHDQQIAASPDLGATAMQNADGIAPGAMSITLPRKCKGSMSGVAVLPPKLKEYAEAIWLTMGYSGGAVAVGQAVTKTLSTVAMNWIAQR